MFDTSIKTPKTPLIRRVGYLAVACLVIGSAFWAIGTLSGRLLQAMTPQQQSEVIEPSPVRANQPIEVMIEVGEEQTPAEAN